MECFEPDQIIKDHYKNIASSFGLDPKATLEDDFIRSVEISFFEQELERFCHLKKTSIHVMDLGCGNGHLLSILSKKFPRVKFCGVEFSKELLTLAQSRDLPNVRFFHGDCRKEETFVSKYDVIITERVIINLLKGRDKIKTFQNISRHLRPGGLYLMCESFREPLYNLNRARSEVGLGALEESCHNSYILENMLEKLKSFGLTEQDSLIKENFLSTYFFLTRVFHSLLRPDKMKIKGTQFVKFFNEALPDSIGNYSPIKFHVYKKN